MNDKSQNKERKGEVLNAIPIQIFTQQALKINIDNIILKFIWKNKGNRIAKTIVIWKNKVKEKSLPHFKTYIATVVKTWMVLTEKQTCRLMEQNKKCRIWLTKYN